MWFNLIFIYIHIKYIMGVWSDYCLICGGPFRNTYDNEDGEKINDPKFEWLNYSYLITHDEKGGYSKEVLDFFK